MKDLLKNIRELIFSARKAAVHSVDFIQVLTNFEIGRRIVEHEQQGEVRAEYGKALLKALSTELTAEFGRGFSRSNLVPSSNLFFWYKTDGPPHLALRLCWQLGRERSRHSGVLPWRKNIL